jgi:hypothetical protein
LPLACLVLHHGQPYYAPEFVAAPNFVWRATSTTLVAKNSTRVYTKVCVMTKLNTQPNMGLAWCGSLHSGVAGRGSQPHALGENLALSIAFIILHRSGNIAPPLYICSRTQSESKARPVSVNKKDLIGHEGIN